MEYNYIKAFHLIFVITCDDNSKISKISLVENSELLIFSTSTLKESLKDDKRYDHKYWDPWVVNQR